MNAPIWASPIIVAAWYICRLFPPICLAMIGYCFIGAIIKFPSFASVVVILSAIFIGLTTLVVTGIFLIPIGLVCFFKDYLIEEDF